MSSARKRDYKRSGSSVRAAILAQRRAQAKVAMYNAARQLAFPSRPLPGLTGTGLYNARLRGNEKKFIDVQTVYNAWNVSRTYIVLLNGVATGTDYNTRIGREIRMTSYYHRMFITDTANIQQVRCMLVYDKQPAGALPAITDILQYNNANSPNNLTVS